MSLCTPGTRAFCPAWQFTLCARANRQVKSFAINKRFYRYYQMCETDHTAFGRTISKAFGLGGAPATPGSASAAASYAALRLSTSKGGCKRRSNTATGGNTGAPPTSVSTINIMELPGQDSSCHGAVECRLRRHGRTPRRPRFTANVKHERG